MSLNLYDVLDVDPSATPDEIRAAWKAAIADLGPGDRRFRAYNDAAEVLLDPERRAVYDAELAAEAEAEQPDDEQPEPEPEPEPEPAGVHPERPGVAPWSVAAVGGLAAAVLVVTILVWSADRDDDQPAEAVGSAEAAVAAAEEAAVPVLSYDYRSLADDVVEAESFMTTSYASEHSKLMSDLESDIAAQKMIVDAQLQGSGIVRVSGDRAEILVMVNQVTEKADTDPFLLPVWATLEMVNEDGEWLVDSITNDGAG